MTISIEAPSLSRYETFSKHRAQIAGCVPSRSMITSTIREVTAAQIAFNCLEHSNDTNIIHIYSEAQLLNPASDSHAIKQSFLGNPVPGIGDEPITIVPTPLLPSSRFPRPVAEKDHGSFSLELSNHRRDDQYTTETLCSLACLRGCCKAGS